MKTTSADTLATVIEFLHKQASLIEQLEKSESPRDAEDLKRYEQLALGCARHKNIAVAGSDRVSEVVRKLTFPIAIAPLKNANAEAAQTRRESDLKSLQALKAIAKGSAFDTKIYDDLATVLREIARVRGIPIEAGASPVEMFERIRPFLEIQGLSLKPRLQ